MKKIFIVVVMAVLVLAIVFISIPKNVQAGYSATKQVLAAGHWNTGTEVDVEISTAPAPEWLQLMTTSAVVINEPTKICHELGGGKFHWVGEIRKLKDGKWIKIETFNNWSPDEEGAFMACAQAPSAGTYALFAYYNGPQEVFSFVEPTIEPTIAPTAFSCADGQNINTGCTCALPRTINKGICMPKNL